MLDYILEVTTKSPLLSLNPIINSNSELSSKSSRPWNKGYSVTVTPRPRLNNETHFLIPVPPSGSQILSENTIKIEHTVLLENALVEVKP